MEMQTLGKWMVLAAVAMAVAGALFWLGGKVGLGSLPGDIRVQREGFSCFLPIVSSILISIVLTLLLNLFFRLFR